ncbi:MAG: hypothetical protein DMF51_02665, partial [Acidobacteria bacterium]
HNKIDDQIDASGDPTFDVMVNYKRCVEDADITFLGSLSVGSKVQRRSRYIPSVAVGELTKADVQRVAALTDVAFVERQVLYHTNLDTSVPNLRVASGFYT